MTIPMFKVRMSPNAKHRAGDVLDSGYIGQGPVCESFEREFGRVVDAPEPPLFVNSCTSAIDLALHLCGLGAGKGLRSWELRPGAASMADGDAKTLPWEVITTPITCTATNSHIWHRGARIVWADVDPLTGNIDPASVARLVTPRTRAVVAVDWAGRACDYDALRRAAPGIPIIEDAAHAFTSRRLGKSIAHVDWYAHLGNVPVGGDYICWSTQAIKHLTTGDGGFLQTPADELERARLLRWYGLNRRSGADFRCAQDITEIGYKYQSNDIAAAIGLANLPGAIESVAASRDNARFYAAAFAHQPGIDVPPYDPGCAYWLFTLCVDDRDGLMAHLKDAGVDSTQTHARNDKHTAFKAASETRIPLPGVGAFDWRQLSIPSGWWVTPSQRERIADLVTAYARKGAMVAA